MRALGMAALALVGALLLQGCGGSSGSKGVAAGSSSAVANGSSVASFSSSMISVSSSATTTSRSASLSSAAGLSAAETHLGAGNLPPDSGIAAAASLAVDDFSPEYSTAAALASDVMPPL